MRLQRRGIAGLLAAMTVFSGCSASDGDPKGALRSYFAAIAAGRFDDAYEALSAASRGKVAAAAGSPGDDDRARAWFRARVTTGGTGAVPWITPATVAVVEIDVARADSASALLNVKSPLGAGQVRMVRERDRWLVDLDL
jgi:hypothetical protein